MKNTFFLKWRQGFLVLLLLCIGSLTYGQTSTTIKGLISDQDGPLAGAAIVVKGTSTGAITDGSGQYSIMAKPDAVLVISGPGYATQEMPVNGQTVVNATLSINAKELEDIVVVGYGAVKRSDITGAVSSIKAEELSFPTANVAEMMRGKAAGVQVSLGTGRPGGDVTIRIRGERSLSSSNSPLYVVDGSPVENINDINSNDIKSIEVLKDASSQAIYGARAANGVVLVTTKRGTETGKVQVSYAGYYGVQSLVRNFDFYSGDEWMQLRREAKRTDNGGEYMTDEETLDRNATMIEAYNTKKYTNWEEELIKPATQQSHDVSLRGGTGKSKFAIGLGFYDQNGMVENTGYTRYTARFNWDYKLLNNLNIGINTSYSHSNQQLEGSDFGSAISYVTATPLGRPYNDDGSLRYATTSSEEHVNPLWKAREQDRENTNNRLNLATFLEWEIIKGLKYRFNASMYTRETESGSFSSKKYKSATGNGVNEASLSNSKNADWQIENQLNFSKIFAEIHNLDVVVAQSANGRDASSMTIRGEDMPFDMFKWDGIPQAQIPGASSRSNTNHNVASFLGRVRYSLMDRYLLTASLRCDGSSVFGKDNKWGYFPSMAVAWKINEEAFLKDIHQISQLKLRFSYGEVGNEAIPSYRTLGVTRSVKMAFGDGNIVTGYLPGGDDSELMNPNLKWETTTSYNIGLDYGFFDSRLSGSIEYYQTHTTDLLVKRSIPSLLGYNFMWDNLGETKTKGIEVNISADAIRRPGNGFRWTIDGNFSLNRSEIVSIFGEKDPVTGKEKDDVTNRWFIGQPISVAYDYIFDGIWQLDDDIAASHMPTAKPGDIRLRDIAGNADGSPDGKVNADDRKIYNMEPSWIGSLTNSFYYKGVDLSVEVYTVQGVLKRNSYLSGSNEGGSLQGNRNGIKVNYWTPENPSNEYPRPKNSTTPAYLSNINLHDASYIRLRTLTLGYTFPKALISKVKMHNARIYVSGNNLFTHTDYLGYSPEYDAGNYPEGRSFICGINVTF